MEVVGVFSGSRSCQKVSGPPMSFVVSRSWRWPTVATAPVRLGSQIVHFSQLEARAAELLSCGFMFGWRDFMKSRPFAESIRWLRSIFRSEDDGAEWDTPKKHRNDPIVTPVGRDLGLSCVYVYFEWQNTTTAGPALALSWIRSNGNHPGGVSTTRFAHRITN